MVGSRSHPFASIRKLGPWALNAPALAVVGGLVLYPLVYSFWLSLHRDNLAQPDRYRFIGVENYRTLLGDPNFWQSLKITVFFTVVSVVLTVTLGLLAALVLNAGFPGRVVLRSIILIPWAIPPVVNGLMWKLAYNANFGVLDGTLTKLGLIHQYIAWLSTPNLAVSATLVAQVWNFFPIAVIVLLAGLQTVPKELAEAARIDGARAVSQFLHITLPHLAGSLLIVLILETMIGFRIFDVIYVLTFGGPGTATSSLAWQAYTIAFSNLDLGYGNAWAYAIALILGSVAAVYIAVISPRQIDA